MDPMEYVRVVTSLGRSGLQDWLLQRASALVLIFYLSFLLGYFIYVPEMNYGHWKALFSSWIVRSFTLITLFALFIHAWIGIWTVCTDYIKNTACRLVVLGMFA